MVKNLIIFSLLSFGLIGTIYPSKKENTKLFDYCYSLEKILSRNSIQNNVPLKFEELTGDIAELGVTKTRGLLINKMIDQYKNFKNSLIIKNVPNKVYCYGGYWIEKVKPGTLESILYEKSNNAITEFKVFKDEVKEVLDNINSEYKFLKN